MLNDRMLPFRAEALAARMTAAEAGPDLTVQKVAASTRFGTMLSSAGGTVAGVSLNRMTDGSISLQP